MQNPPSSELFADWTKTQSVFDLQEMTKNFPITEFSIYNREVYEAIQSSSELPEINSSIVKENFFMLISFEDSSHIIIISTPQTNAVHALPANINISYILEQLEIPIQNFVLEAFPFELTNEIIITAVQLTSLIYHAESLKPEQSTRSENSSENPSPTVH